MPSFITLLPLLFLLTPRILAHIVLWDPSMFGWDPNNINQNDMVTPLADMTFDQWWFHGKKGSPPQEGVFMELPAGGVYKGQLACNKAQTIWNPEVTDPSTLNTWACDSAGPMHTTDSYGNTNPTNVKGTGLAIAYTSDENAVKPEDFTVFSVDYTSPWWREVDYHVPADLPSCPEGGCLCSWGWVHSPESGSEQIYHVVYRCKVTGATNTTPLPKPLVARKCDYPMQTSNCTVGGKQPHYWLQKEGNNNFQDYYDPPYYNNAYGFMPGAQTDLFAGITHAPVSTTLATPPVSSSVIPPVISSTVEVAPIPSTQPDSQPTTASQGIESVRVSSTSELVSSSTAILSTTTSLPVPSASAPPSTCRLRQKRRIVDKRRTRLLRHSRFEAVADRNSQRRVLLDRARLLAAGLDLMQQKGST